MPEMMPSDVFAAWKPLEVFPDLRFFSLIFKFSFFGGGGPKGIALILDSLFDKEILRFSELTGSGPIPKKSDLVNFWGPD